MLLSTKHFVVPLKNPCAHTLLRVLIHLPISQNQYFLSLPLPYPTPTATILLQTIMLLVRHLNILIHRVVTIQPQHVKKMTAPSQAQVLTRYHALNFLLFHHQTLPHHPFLTQTLKIFLATTGAVAVKMQTTLLTMNPYLLCSIFQPLVVYSCPVLTLAYHLLTNVSLPLPTAIPLGVTVLPTALPIARIFHLLHFPSQLIQML
jgi:hypothetical protein